MTLDPSTSFVMFIMWFFSHSVWSDVCVFAQTWYIRMSVFVSGKSLRDEPKKRLIPSADVLFGPTAISYGQSFDDITADGILLSLALSVLGFQIKIPKRGLI